MIRFPSGFRRKYQPSKKYPMIRISSLDLTVFALRSGALDGTRLTLEQTGKLVGLSRPRVHQLWKKMQRTSYHAYDEVKKIQFGGKE